MVTPPALPKQVAECSARRQKRDLSAWHDDDAPVLFAFVLNFLHANRPDLTGS
jgi:hypothetical protein